MQCSFTSSILLFTLLTLTSAATAANELTLLTGGATHALKKTAVNPLGIAGGADIKKVEASNPDATAKPGTKDPLAYKVLQLPGGTAAKFDNWQYGNITTLPNAIFCDAVPEGRAKDFLLRTVVGTPSEKDLANLFVARPQASRAILAQIFGPVFKPKGEAQKCTCGGDEAMLEEYEGDVRGTAYTCRIMYVKRKDVAIAVIAIGTEAGFKEFGRAIEIAAQSITLKESTVEPGLIGTWTLESFASAGEKDKKINVAQARSVTIYPNGTFSDTAQSGFSGRQIVDMVKGGNRGTVVKRGNVLTFHYDDGHTWSPAYEVYASGLKIDGKIYLK